METIQQAPVPSASPTNSQPGLSYRMQHSKALVAIVAVLGVTVMALAAALVVNKSNAEPDPYKSSPAAMTAPVSKLAADSSKPNHTNVVKHTSSPAVVAQAPRANVCAECGTVEAVTAVQREGQVNGVAVGNTTIGLGTVAGGVLGGLLGNQVGGGNGKTLATVAGVAGGAYAGNTIEKNMKKVTVYDVRVRMDNGTTRNMEISSAVAVGSKVVVEGKNLRMATSAG
ncbi:MAG: glycine zipper 2TM domain-containing protein [Polaromonas sp.]|nr:glycine zipper 2TM domain-containing protein [Polaromonas sp.]